MGFAPFGIVEGDGMQVLPTFVRLILSPPASNSEAARVCGAVDCPCPQVVRKIHNIGQRPDQDEIQAKGNAYLDEAFPQLTKIIRATVLGAAKAEL